jgi:hypothetical protein
MKKILNKKPVKAALTLLLIALFSITLCPVYSPVINIIRMFVGSCVIGWWTGKGLVKIWYK